MAGDARAPLTRERVLEAALALADGSGADAVTMRRLGEELGFEAMSLYRHVANKQDLFAGMLDRVLAEWQLPVEGADWAEAIRGSARSVHDALRRHPWAARLLMTGAHLRPARLAYMDALLGRIRQAGFDAETTYYVYHLLDGYIFGFSLWEIAYSAVPVDTEAVSRLLQSIPWESYPQLAAHRDQHLGDGAHRDVDAFVVGLDLILDGLQEKLGR
jgi:AcrR family transcriptional regulator